MHKLSEKPSALKREHPALQNMNLLYFFLFFFGSFLPSWIRIQIQNVDPDPDLATKVNADPDPQPSAESIEKLNKFKFCEMYD